MFNWTKAIKNQMVKSRGNPSAFFVLIYILLYYVCDIRSIGANFFQKLLQKVLTIYKLCGAQMMKMQIGFHLSFAGNP